MWYVVSGIMVFAIFYLIVKLNQSSTPRGFARGVARAQLLSFYTFRNYKPNTPIDEIYLEAIMTRPGYDRERVLDIISSARADAQEKRLDFKFWIVVLNLVAHEYLWRTGKSPFPVMNQLIEGVLSVIPPDL